MLHQATQRTRPVDRVVAALGKPLARIGIHLNLQPPLGQPLLELLHPERHDLRELLGRERIEHHQLIEPVDELGLERLPHRRHHRLVLLVGRQQRVDQELRSEV